MGVQLAGSPVGLIPVTRKSSAAPLSRADAVMVQVPPGYLQRLMLPSVFSAPAAGAPNVQVVALPDVDGAGIRAQTCDAARISTLPATFKLTMYSAKATPTTRASAAAPTQNDGLARRRLGEMHSAVSVVRARQLGWWVALLAVVGFSGSVNRAELARTRANSQTTVPLSVQRGDWHVDLGVCQHWRVEGLSSDVALGDEEEMLENGTLRARQPNSSLLRTEPTAPVIGVLIQRVVAWRPSLRTYPGSTDGESWRVMFGGW